MDTITNQPELVSVVLERCQLLKTAMQRLALCELDVNPVGLDGSPMLAMPEAG